MKDGVHKNVYVLQEGCRRETRIETSLRRLRHLNYCRLAKERGELNDEQLCCEECEFVQDDPYYQLRRGELEIEFVD